MKEWYILCHINRQELHHKAMVSLHAGNFLSEKLIRSYKIPINKLPGQGYILPGDIFNAVHMNKPLK